ncbi:MAG: zinc ribbon domain-containing protein [Clostridiales bacterium]
MALFDKIGSVTKGMADKAGDMLEITKRNSKINEEKGKIAALKMKIGDYYWEQFQAGAQIDEQAAALCANIKEALAAIESLELEIQQIKGSPQQPVAAPVELACANCGTAIPPGKKFCPECGKPVSDS